MTSVGFLRPRMGIGGSERLVTDAATALVQRGHTIRLFVPERGDVVQFPEWASHRIPFETHGAFLPTHVLGRLRAPMAILRTAYAGWHASRLSEVPQVIFCDVVPHVVPLVKRLVRAPVLYYCHFPDLLLTREGMRTNAVYGTYRRPLDNLEARGLAAADLILTNSYFTAGIVRRTFPTLRSERMSVLYPGVVVRPAPVPRAASDDIVLLSVSRFDPRKNLGLAVDALAHLRSRVTPAVFARTRLVLAGHFDARLPESVSLVDQLRRQVTAAGLDAHVEFAFSPTETQRIALLARSVAVVYTPTAEHFGYVPVEAMAAGRAVVAVNHGGPSETVVDRVTGFLCEPTPSAFASAFEALVANPDAADSMGEAGRARVSAHFSLDSFGDRLHALIEGLAAKTKTS